MVQKHYANNYISNKYLLSILISFSLIQSVTSQCNSLNCPPLRGLCSNNICVCEEGFTTVNNKYIKTNGIFCNYILKSRYIAFILEFFFPFGAGHFYSGKTIFASIKLGIFVAIIISFIALLCFNPKKRNGENTAALILSIILILCLLSLIIFQIFDLIAYAAGIYSDGNGVSLN